MSSRTTGAPALAARRSRSTSSRLPRPMPRMEVATQSRLSSAHSGTPSWRSWNRRTPQPTGSSLRVATTRRPAGATRSAGASGVPRLRSNPPSKRASSSSKYAPRLASACGCSGSHSSRRTIEAMRSRSTSAMALASCARCGAPSGSRIASATAFERRSSSARSTRPARVRRAVRTRRSASLDSMVTRPSVASACRTRLRYPESSPSWARSERRSAPFWPISQRTRAWPSGRPRARNASSSAPTRCVTTRLNRRTCAMCSSVIL